MLHLLRRAPLAAQPSCEHTVHHASIERTCPAMPRVARLRLCRQRLAGRQRTWGHLKERKAIRTRPATQRALSEGARILRQTPLPDVEGPALTSLAACCLPDGSGRGFSAAFAHITFCPSGATAGHCQVGNASGDAKSISQRNETSDAEEGDSGFVPSSATRVEWS